MFATTSSDGWFLQGLPLWRTLQPSPSMFLLVFFARYRLGKVTFSAWLTPPASFSMPLTYTNSEIKIGGEDTKLTKVGFLKIIQIWVGPKVAFFGRIRNVQKVTAILLHFGWKLPASYSPNFLSWTPSCTYNIDQRSMLHHGFGKLSKTGRNPAEPVEIR